MSATLDGLASVDRGRSKEIALRWIAEGQFEDLSKACRAGLRRLDDDARVVARLALLGTEGMASGMDEEFDIDAFVEEVGTAA